MYLHMCMKTTGIEEGLIISLSEETCTNSKVGLMGFLFFDVFHLTELAREREREKKCIKDESESINGGFLYGRTIIYIHIYMKHSCF